MNESRTLVPDQQSSPFLVFRLSWVAYAHEALRFVVRLILCGVVTTLLSLALDRWVHTHTEAWLPLMGGVAAIIWTTYAVMFTNSVRLYTDENGVWMQSGVFPWEKGVTGVQWRDLGQAGYTQGIVSWALRSYAVRISHRFTTGAELYLRNVHRGNLAVEHINGIMARLQGRIFTA